LRFLTFNFNKNCIIRILEPRLRLVARLDEYEALLVVGGTATGGVRCCHDPLAATARHADRRPPRLPVQHSVTRAPAATDAATHHQRLALDAQPSARYQQLGPLTERSPAARPTILCQPKMGTVAAVVGVTYHNKTQPEIVTRYWHFCFQPKSKPKTKLRVKLR